MKTDAGGSDALYLPDFCTSRATLGIVLIVELTALLLTLARQSATIDFWTDLGRTSLFLLWIGLAGAALLCALRPRLARMTVAVGSAAVLALISTVIAAVSICAYLFGRTALVVDSGGAGLFPAAPWVFVLRNVAIGLIVTGLALRYFYVAHEWRRSVELRAAARVHALQARIRPHFLFNSMNTIAALTRSNPPRAEGAVQDLADLFRAALSDKRDTITLAEELEVARTYQRIEQLRLGKRLQVEWKTESLPPEALVPGLMIQPLLENAIYHGIEPRPRRRHGHDQRRGRRRARNHRGQEPTRPRPRTARRQPPGARQYSRAPEPHVRRARAHEIGALRRRVHRHPALPAHREPGAGCGRGARLSPCPRRCG